MTADYETERERHVKQVRDVIAKMLDRAATTAERRVASDQAVRLALKHGITAYGDLFEDPEQTARREARADRQVEKQARQRDREASARDRYQDLRDADQDKREMFLNEWEARLSERAARQQECGGSRDDSRLWGKPQMGSQAW